MPRMELDSGVGSNRIHNMPLTFEEVKDRLKQQDEISLLEILDISSEDLVNRFEDLVELKLNELQEELADEETDE
jgi:hypothetical protein